jgi:hypothetical protein
MIYSPNDSGIFKKFVDSHDTHPLISAKTSDAMMNKKAGDFAPTI